MENEEQLMRTVTLFGNGAHIFVPKAWAGEQIFVLKPSKKTLREKILGVLEPYLESIVGVYIYGSYARGEQQESSDIDLFIVTDKKITLKEKGFEIICLEQSKIVHAIKLEPLLMYSILSEAKPLINSNLLDELRGNYRLKLNDFSAFFKESDRIIKINQAFLDLERGIYVSGDAVIYSLVLRLRGLFILQSLLSKKLYSHKDFKKWLSKKLPEIDFDLIYSAYRASKDEEKIYQKIKTGDLALLLEFLKNELSKLKDGKTGKTT